MPKKIAIRHRKSEQRQEEIIEAALACFSEFGFARTTMEDIRRRSGASNGSIYHHFTSKEALAAAVYLDGLAEYQKGLLAELERHKRAQAGIHSIVSYHLRWVTDHRHWARYLWEMRHTESVAGVETAIAEQNRQFVKRVLRWIQPRVEVGELRRLPIDLFISLVIGPCQEYTRAWLGGYEPMELHAAIKELGRAAWLGVRAER